MSAPGPTPPPATSPWHTARRVGHRLAAWALLSVVGGGVLAWSAAAFARDDIAETLRAVALQFVAWGAIDGAIAGFGERDRRRRIARGEHHDPAATHAFGTRLRRLLRLNAGLDLVYVAVGIGLATLWRTPAGLGHGLGILVQGGFLLALDAWYGYPGPSRGADAPARRT